VLVNMRWRGAECKNEPGFWMIDLHCHSTESDGAVTPAGLVDLAVDCGLSALALTDHDTVSGIDAFLAAGQGRPLRTVPGVEIACQGEGSNIMHVVGLWMDHRDPALLRLLETIREGRRRRNICMADRLRQLGCALDLKAVEALAGGAVVGRPHFAKALINGGFCRNHRDAFDRFLGRGKPGYVQREITPVEEVLTVLSSAGGVCIWAHPLMGNSVTGAYLRRVVERLRPLGLDGIEVYYADYGPTETRNAMVHTEALGLLQSGGTDFHGTNVPGIAIGVGRGKLNTPDALLPPLEQRAREKAARAGSGERPTACR
jgi:predicted metal-dependent phosphoesterase TrpH